MFRRGVRTPDRVFGARLKPAPDGSKLQDQILARTESHISGLRRRQSGDFRR